LHGKVMLRFSYELKGLYKDFVCKSL